MAKTERVRVTDWTLRGAPDIVRKLKRDAEGIMVVWKPIVGLMGVPGLWFHAPPEVSVYAAIPPHDETNAIFFTAKKGKDWEPGYASAIWGNLPSFPDTPEKARSMLEFPWFDAIMTEYVFDRLARRLAKPTSGLTSQYDGTHHHPLAMKFE